MSIQNTSEIKENIILILKKRGPSIPVHIAKEINQSMLFTSAFLSELLSEKKLKTSYMRVGSSPIYFIHGQEPLLEKYSEYLKSKEKDAFFILKERKFLSDEKQEPAIRVALRAIRDFAIPFKKDEKILWRYFTIPEQEFYEKPKEIKKDSIDEIEKKEVSETNKIQEIKKEKIEEEEKEIKTIKEEDETKEKKLNIFEENKKKIPLKSEIKKSKNSVRKKSSKNNDKFFNKIKEFLSEKSIDIIDIKNFDKKELTLIVKNRNSDSKEEKLLIAYNKKRVNEADIIKAYKKASEIGLKYTLICLGEPTKKIRDLINAIKKLSEIEIIE